MRVEDAKQQNGLDDVTIVSQSQDRIIPTLEIDTAKRANK
jgi:hypothetical protein